jgi:hypothetical protein
MASTPLSLRLDKDLLSLLAEGKRRTPLKKQELIRRTLRLHLRQVIDQEAFVPAARVTAVDPLPRGVMAKTYKRLARIEKDWDKIEQAGIKAQSIPSWED